MRHALILIGCLAGASAVAAETVMPAPFSATYVASYRGITGGTLNLTLKAESTPGRFSFETHVDPNLVASLFVSSQGLERSDFMIDGQDVRPLDWKVDDGKNKPGSDSEAHFDWEHRVVNGSDAGKSFTLPLSQNVQDRMSIQIPVMAALLNNREPGTLTLIDGDRAKDYVYTRVRSEKLKTKLGELDTVVYESKRAGAKPNDRLQTFWYAPSLGYLTVKAEQARKGKVETVIEISEFKR